MFLEETNRGKYQDTWHRDNEDDKRDAALAEVKLRINVTAAEVKSNASRAMIRIEAITRISIADFREITLLVKVRNSWVM